MPTHPSMLPHTGPAGSAPSMPLDEFDIRIDDDVSSGGFVRRLWWRATVPVPEEQLLHTLIAVYVTDVYMIDPALQVHGHSMRARSHRSGTTDSSIWFHQPVRADQWNLLESTSPAAARGRGVVTASLIRADGVIAATLVQEGLIAAREPGTDIAQTNVWARNCRGRICKTSVWGRYCAGIGLTGDHGEWLLSQSGHDVLRPAAASLIKIASTLVQSYQTCRY